MLSKIILKATPAQKLGITIMAITLGMVAILLISFNNIKNHDKISNAKILVHKIDSDILTLRRNEKDFLARKDIKYREKFIKNATILNEDIKSVKILLNSINIKIDPKMFSDFRSYIKNYEDTFLSISDKVLKIQELKDEALKIKLRKEVGEDYRQGLHLKMRENIHKAEKLVFNRIENLNKIFRDKVTKDRYFTIGVSMLVLLSIFFLIFMIMRDIGDTLRRFKSDLEGFFAYLNGEKDDLVYLDESSNGTVGQISKDINKFIKKTKENIAKDKEAIDHFISTFSDIGKGELLKRLNVDTQNSHLLELQNISNKMIEELHKNIKTPLDMLKLYEKQDFRAKIDDSKLQYDFKELANGINQLRDSIVNLIKENQQNAKTLKEHSKKLSSQTELLIDRTKKQASNMSRSQESIKNASKSILKGNHSIESMAVLTSRLLSSVDSGKELVSNTNKSMDIINNQAQEIKKTLKIIDEIALQTSILSLNAAVEASTAGDAGKGFGVVAKEVRDLATKSKNAADAIKKIVENTSDKIGTGKDISEKLSLEFNQLSDIIHQTTNHIDELSSNMQIQNLALKDMNEMSVSTLKNSIQESSSVVEETKKVASKIDLISDDIVKSITDGVKI